MHRVVEWNLTAAVPVAVPLTPGILEPTVTVKTSTCSLPKVTRLVDSDNAVDDAQEL